MAIANLTADYLRSIMHYDPATGVFARLVRTSNRIKTGDEPGNVRADGYREIRVCGKSYLTHRLAWLYVHGVWPVDQIDHINGVRNDNRISNLREADRVLNGQNQRRPRSDNTSGFLGVSKWGDAWIAQIMVDRKQRHLGFFPTPEAASEAYLAEKRRFHAGCTI